jgi:hypothetical protein
MAVQVGSIEATLDLVRERALRLEQESAALCAELDQVAIQLGLQKIAVSETEIASYRKLTGAQFPDTLLRLALQAQKAATRLKQSVQPEEREIAIRAVLTAFQQVAASLGLTLPDELEAAIGD